MIKKNLFILLCLYLFAVQPSICGLLWGDNRFFWLAIPNFIVILLILILSNKWKWEKIEEWHHNPVNINESKLYEMKDTETKIIKNKKIRQWKKINISNIRFFIIAVLIWVFVYLSLWTIVSHLKLLISVVCSFIAYILLWSIFSTKIFKTKLSVVYIILLILSWIRSIISMFNLVDNINISWELAETWAINELIDEKDLVMTWIIDNSVDTWMILSWTNSGETIIWEIILEKTWTEIIEDNLDEDNLETIKYSWWDSSLATFTDVLKFLLKDTTLLRDTKVAFQNISKTNPDYPYFRTAYEKKMIWTDIQPNQKPSCETFVVMKWLAEWWSVWTYSNIKQAYWQYASTNGKLPDCKYWSNIKIWEMK